MGLVLGFANWKTLVVLTIAVPVFYLVHKYILSPIAQGFVKTGLPRFITRYRAFLGWILQRDYSPKYSMLRNTFALGSFTLGVVLLIGSGIVSGLAGPMAGLILQIPGGVLLALGRRSDMPVIRDAPLVLNACGSGRLLPDSGSVGFFGSMLLPAPFLIDRKHKELAYDKMPHQPDWPKMLINQINLT